MLLRYFYDEKLAQASYLVGCQATGEGIIIDPSRDIIPYLKVAKEQGIRIVAATETHIHADFISGARELAATVNAKLYLSDEGTLDWKYQNLNQINHQLVKDGDIFMIGNIEFKVMHTPGHTPESISLLLTDRGGRADQPMGLFTGDFVFVGDIGRPDLLERAVGIQGSADEGARQMFASLNRFKELPDHLQVWPGHGAGSACGKALGAVPSSTVGYEKMFNWALAFDDEEEFVNALLEGQPEAPRYFKYMKHSNKVGPSLLSKLPTPKEILSAKSEVYTLLKDRAMIIDTRSNTEFSRGHIHGTINIPYDRSFTNWAGWIVDYESPLYLLIDKNQFTSILHDLYSVGIDHIAGYIDLAVINEYSTNELESYENKTPSEMASLVKNEQVHILDVRNLTEYEEGHIPGAQHIMLGTLAERIEEIPLDKPIMVHCKGGGRSAIGTSILQAHGINNVVNLAGGYQRWSQEGNQIERNRIIKE